MNTNPNPNENLPEVREMFHVVLSIFTLTIIVVLLIGEGEGPFRLLLLESLIFVPALVFVRFKAYDFKTVFRMYPVHPILIVLGILVGLGLSVLADELHLVMQRYLPMRDEIRDALTRTMTFDSNGEFLLLFLGVVLAAGLGEEMLFRGFVQGILERATDVTKGVLYSTLIFTWMHFNPWWTMEIFSLGLFCGVLAWRARSIYPAVAVHMTVNGLSLWLTNMDEVNLNWYLLEGHVHPIWLVLATGFVVVGFILTYRFTRGMHAEVEN